MFRNTPNGPVRYQLVPRDSEEMDNNETPYDARGYQHDFIPTDAPLFRHRYETLKRSTCICWDRIYRGLSNLICYILPTCRMVTHHKRLQYYKRHYGMVCITGMFGCRWHRYQQSTEATHKRDLVWFGFFILVTMFVLFWFYFWIITSNSEDLMNWYAYKHTGSWYPWYTVLLVLTSLTTSYIALIGFLSLCHVGHGHQLYMHHSHKVVLIIILLVGALAAVGINAIWPPGWSLIYQSIMITGPFLHIALVAVMTMLSWFIAGQWMLLYNTGARIVWLGIFMAVMVLLYIFPIFINSPCVVEQDDLPPKPFILAHKGASAVNPENTLIAFQSAAALSSVLTLESDVSISYDGVPFILHDTTLTRTTNVKEIFPEMADMEACRFNISQLQQLDAGSWFRSRDPFRTVGQINDSNLKQFSNQTIILLKDLLDVAYLYKKNVMFDIKFKCKNHPHEKNFGDIIVQTILNHTLPSKNMWWLAINRNISRSDVFTLVWDEPETSQFLLNKSVSHVNYNFGEVSHDKLRDLKSNNISVNLYVVNVRWLYSLYWCMGLNSVTSDHVHIFNEMKSPVWRLDPTQFKIMWITCDCLSAAIVIIFFVIQRYRKIGKTFHGETMSLQGPKVKMSHTKHNRNMKEKLLHTVESLQDIDIGINGIDSDPLPPTPQMARASLGYTTTGSVNGDEMSIGTVSHGSVRIGGCPDTTSYTSENTTNNTGLSQTPEHDYTVDSVALVKQADESSDERAAELHRLSTLSGVSKLSNISGLTEVSESDLTQLSAKGTCAQNDDVKDIKVDFY